MENQQAQLTTCQWFLEEEKKTEELLNHIRHTLGTFEAERNVTFHFFVGYLAGIKKMYRKFEDAPIVPRR